MQLKEIITGIYPKEINASTRIDEKLIFFG
jgi:hypothetical protein